MCRKLICLVSIVFVLGLASSASADLVGWWKFDDGAGATTAADSSGNGYDGTLGGISDWVAGRYGGALAFNGAGWIDVPVAAWNDNIFDGFSVCFWAYTDNTTQTTVPITMRTGSNGARNFSCHVPWNGTIYFDVRPASGNYQRINVGGTSARWVSQWSQWTFVYTPGQQQIYLNGALFLSGTGIGAIRQDTTGFTIASDNAHASPYFGTLDDVRLYNNVLTQTEIEDIFVGGPGYPRGPSPVDKKTDVPFDVILSWKSGANAASHDVYLGTNQADVTAATRLDKRGVQVSQGQAGTICDTDKNLAFSTTYYWKVDEVSADGTTYNGAVWSFTIEPVSNPLVVANVKSATASSNTASAIKTVNQAGLDTATKLLHGTTDTDMWLSDAADTAPWIKYEFDKIYMLNQMQVWNHNSAMETLMGFGIKEAKIEVSTNDVNYTPLAANVTFNQAPGTPGYAANTTVNLNVAAKFLKITPVSNYSMLGLKQYGLAEVSFTWIPVLAREPVPASGATGIAPEVVMSWRAGRYAVSHDVYFDPNQQKVIDGNAPVTNVPLATLTKVLPLSQTYYWRVDEVNSANVPASLPGDVWNFKTADYVTVDNMESPDTPWVASGGASIAVNAVVANAISHSGFRSLALSYNNTVAGNSEISLDTSKLIIGSDWSKGDPTTLVIYFYGDLTNAVENMYAKISAVNGPIACVATLPYDGDATKLTRPIWNPWNIDLAELGINLGDITNLTIGLGDGPGGSGVVLLDDIRLYRVAPALATDEVWVEAEAVERMVSPMQIYYDPLASGGLYVTTKTGAVNSTSAPADLTGEANYKFTVKGGTYRILCRVIAPSGSNDSMWVRVVGATTNVAIHTTGWVQWNTVAQGSTWHWDNVESAQASNGVVYFTLPAGTYTLDVAHSEIGLKLDSILITDKLTD